jgi:pyrroline-5-carboxylate reductase
MDPLGLFSVLPSENLVDVVSGLCGSSPAFLFMMVDAMADAGVRMGMPRAVAESLAAKTMEGSAKMVLQSDEHPMQLASNVCSPGGTTIEGVYRLNRAGFKGSVMDAVIGSIEKTQGKKTQ